MLPLPPGIVTAYLLPLLIGAGFGFILESSGFGDSRRLSAQFYLTEMRVLKVMFGAIVTAAALLLLASGSGLLDLDRVWINHTWLPSQVVGGLLMGVGFIVGGFCPGTSLVAASTLKIDGIVFLAGVVTGISVFGETLPRFESFYHTAPLGRFTLYDWLGVPAGTALLLVTGMALLMFLGGEMAERYFGAGVHGRLRDLLPRSGGLTAMAVVAGVLSLSAAFVGQPGPEWRWERLAATEQPRLDRREVQVHPAEVVDLLRDPSVSVRIFDLRSESEFNLFHIAGSVRVEPDQVADAAFARSLAAPAGTARVTILTGSGEQASTAAWKLLRAQGVDNLYLIEGGINRWLDVFPLDPCIARDPEASDDVFADRPAHVVLLAAGGRSPASSPELPHASPSGGCLAADLPALSGSRQAAIVRSSDRSHAGPSPVGGYRRKIKLSKVQTRKGGCG